MEKIVTAFAEKNCHSSHVGILVATTLKKDTAGSSAVYEANIITVYRDRIKNDVVVSRPRVFLPSHGETTLEKEV